MFLRFTIVDATRRSPHPIACRERGRLEKEAEDALCLQQEDVHRRMIGVGRYELSLDIMAEDLEDTQEKLAKVRCKNVEWPFGNKPYTVCHVLRTTVPPEPIRSGRCLLLFRALPVARLFLYCM